MKGWLWGLALMMSGVFAQDITTAESRWFAEMDRIAEISNLSEQQQAWENLHDQLPRSMSPQLHYEWLSLSLSIHYQATQHEAVANDIQALLKLADDSGLSEPRIEAWITQAYDLKEAGNVNEALKLMRDALALLENVDNANLRYRTYNQSGAIYAEVGDYENALKEHLRSLPIAEAHQQQHPQWLARALNNIATVYLSLHHTDEALTFIERALPLAQALGDQRMLSTLYLNKGYGLSDQGHHAEARKAILQALAIAEKEGLQRYQLGALVNLSDSSLSLGNFNEAETFARRARQVATEMGETTNAAISQANIGLAQIGLGQIKQGIHELETAYQYFVKSNNPLMQDALLTELAAVYEQHQSKSDAIQMLKAQLELRKKLYDEGRQKAVTEFQERYAAKEKQKQIEKLEQENRLQAITLENQSLQRWIGGLIFVVVLLIAVVTFLSYRRIREANATLAEVNAKLADQTIRDPLTGLFNRRSFHLAMERRNSDRERRQSPEHGADVFVLLDVDHFKQVNDSYGHSAGDAVLVEIGKRLSGIMRDTDMVLRWGGEEFLVYLRSASLDSVHEVVERILMTIGQTPIDVGSQSIAITASAGYVPLPFAQLSEHIFDWERAVQLADSALYLCKTKGRNQAIGVIGLHQPIEQIQDKLAHDWSNAISEGWVTLQAVAGPHIKSTTIGAH